ncbi:DUF402 domain-containing protein [Heyndrickxia sp. NPDC080065]|uniref:DUF402 domain-containing protein n=1 Tax=Heyndrickxia sp. NPDC080065 TaxID=3390568 RepID=UPI003D01EBCB
MLKRKYGDRSDWKRILKRRYVQSYFELKEFSGYVTLLNMEKVKEQLYAHYNDKKICIVDDGYCWLQHFPKEERYSLTTMFNSAGEVVQWYIDICFDIGIENGVPWMEDLFLDIVILPSGEVMLLVVEELEDALSDGKINQFVYQIAWDEANQLLKRIHNDQFDLIKFSTEHKNKLINILSG